MVRTKLLVILAVLTSLIVVTPRSYAAPQPNGNLVDRYIVQFDPATMDAPGRAHALAAKYGIGVSHTYSAAIKGFAGVIPANRLEALKAEAGIIAIEPDTLMSISYVQSGKPGGGGGSTGQTLPTGIDRIDGELSSAVAGNGSGAVDVDVAIIDTGIDLNHSDLTVAGGANCSSGSSYADGNGHGTHVAGTIGAKDNTTGVVGVAPGARLWAVRVLDNSGSGTRSAVICGIDWVTANASTIEVANMSLGGTGSDDGKSCAQTTDAYKKAICNSVTAGVTYVVAAGNSATNAATSVPAAYDMVITVSALADFDGKTGGLGAATCRADGDDTFASFSNYGADVDIIAPGVCINSTWKGGGYNTISGTSMASPHVAGAAALYLASHPGSSPSQVQSALTNAGTTNWNNSDDGDSTKERLLNVDNF